MDLTKRWRDIHGGTLNRLSGRAVHRKDGPIVWTGRDIEKVRAQARDLYRYNPIARGVINSIVANLVGVGIRPQPRVTMPKKLAPNDVFNDAAAELWMHWSDAADVTGKESYYSQQELLEREYYVGGESLLVFRDTPDNKLRFALETISSERLAMKDEPDRKDGSKCVQGVEFAPWGAIRGYWVWPNHPWDGTFKRVSDPQFVHASEVLHLHDALEPGQVRGISRFDTVGGAFEGYLQWMDFLLTKERVASAFAMAITKNVPLLGTPEIASAGTSADQLKDDLDRDLELLEGGILAHLEPGEDIRGVPSGVQASAVDMLSQVFLRLIARGLDVAYELISRDLTKVTYLSAREGANQDRRHWEPQQERLNRQINVPVWRQFIRAANIAGLLPIRGLDSQAIDRYFAVEFVRPGWDWIDPIKDIQADVLACKAGLRSPQEVILKRGRDAWKTIDEIAEFKEYAKKKGLELGIFQQRPESGAPGGGGEVQDPKEKEAKEPAGAAND